MQQSQKTSAAYQTTSIWKLRLTSLSTGPHPFAQRFYTPSVAGTTASSSGNGLVCSFGKKHYGRPLSLVVAEDPAYCRWVLRRAKDAFPPAGLRQLAESLRLAAPNLQESSGRVEAGKHLGQDLGEVADKDPAYCQWILRTAEEWDSSDQIQAMASWLKEKAPHVQEQGPLVGGRKHYGRPISELVHEDPVFCQWILRTAKEADAGEGVRELAGWLNEHAPHLKEPQASSDLREMAGWLTKNVPYLKAEDVNASEVLHEKARWLKENAPHLKDMAVAGGNQHYGRSLADLVVEDPSHCQWVLKAAQEPGAPTGLKANAGWLSENAPHLKEAPVVQLRSLHRGVPLPQIVAEDPLWCLWVMEEPKAFCKQFGEISDWFGKHAPELRAIAKADGPALERISEKFFQKYGRIFLVRRGKHRMKTFARVMEEAPKYVEQTEKRLKSQQETDRTGHLYKNDCFLVAFAKEQRTQEQSAAASGLHAVELEITCPTLASSGSSFHSSAACSPGATSARLTTEEDHDVETAAWMFGQPGCACALFADAALACFCSISFWRVVRQLQPYVLPMTEASKFGRRFCTPSVAGTAASGGWNGLVFSFGKKHYGRPLSQVVAEDPAYCRRILRRASLSSREGANVPAGLQQVAELLRLAAPYLQENGGQAEASASSGDSGRGKHLEQDLDEVADKDQAMASSLKEKSPHMQDSKELGLLVAGRKHSGRPISELVHEDPAFCQWILRKAEDSAADENIRAAADWLNENAPHLKELGVLASGGKHRNRPMSEVVVQDPAYCQWILREGQEKEASSELRDMARWLMKNAPHLKDDKLVYASGGRHQGRLTSEVVVEDPAYCQWIIRMAKDDLGSKALREKACWLTENAQQLKERPVCGGKQHKGRCLHELVAEDPPYCQWILRAGQEPGASRELKEQAGWLSEHAPHLKEAPVVATRSVHRGVPLPQIVAEDPLWCRWVMEQPKAFSKAFSIMAEWFRQHVPELLETSKADLATFDRLGRKFFERYGGIFVVRRGPHRLKTFRRVVEESPESVKWAEKWVKREPDGKGFRYKNRYFLAAFAKRSSTQEQSATTTSSESLSTVSGASHETAQRMAP
ncbi:unnamed protein product [Symbiodinium sp. KB8]|nr:unnamed protein product [Symbiodinium sp. KB8]